MCVWGITIHTTLPTLPTTYRSMGKDYAPSNKCTIYPTIHPLTDTHSQQQQQQQQKQKSNRARTILYHETVTQEWEERLFSFLKDGWMDEVAGLSVTGSRTVQERKEGGWSRLAVINSAMTGGTG